MNAAIAMLRERLLADSGLAFQPPAQRHALRDLIYSMLKANPWR